MKNKYLLAIAAFFLSVTAFSEPVKPVTFKVDPSKTTLGWLAKKVTGQHNGTVGISTGELVLDGLAIKSGSFEIAMNSIVIEDIKDAGSNGKLLGHLKSDDFFSVAKFPTATFDLISATPLKGSTYTVKGNLTIKGITNVIEFPAEISFQGKTMTATAKITIDRTKFDIRYRSSNFFENLGDRAIYDDFTLDLNLTATAG